MELDELKQLWQESTQQLAASLRLNRLLLAQSNLRRVETALGRLGGGITFELLLTLAGIVLVGWFAAENPQPRFLIPAALIDVYAIGMVVAYARQLVMLRTTDYDEPVVAIARRLEELRVLRVRSTLGALLFGPLMWMPFFIVGARLLWGVDVYAVAGPAWLVANVFFGLAVIPASIAVARVFGPRLRGSGALRALADEVAGRSLMKALDDLAAVTRFAEEA